ncbi:rhombotarget A [Acinetobacter sp. ANC 4648]|uniref:rhombotarget A n=1 Tax=Acinetobacter sp. ANC 4648 TaxID=1977875 RepID=UPI000A3490B2|nr:rhombotarget A [Acinetobacter sp. ANC 4648]OTG81670.1 rhombotarget A [Acinetobacter sp. ANC 4648]
MLKRGIGLGLLCFAGHAYSANITVTTTEDVVKADDQCSLREAVEYVNQGMPEAGYNGCGGKEATNTIILNGKSEYKLNNQIAIYKTVQIKSSYEANVTENNILGKNNAVIKMVGKDRLFLVDHTLAPPITNADGTIVDNSSLILVQFNEVSLVGCGQSSCVDQGGLIYNKDALSIQYGQLLKGNARQGGAIYNSGIYDKNKALSSVSLTNTLIKTNKANQGAVIYSEIPQFIVSQSVVQDNEVIDAEAALFDVRDGFDEETSKNAGIVLSRGIWNSTIFNNKGYIVKVFDGMLVNNVTMIMNTMGLIFNAPFNQAYVANSILAKNGVEDCKIIAGGDATHISNNLYSVGCAGTGSQTLGQVNLIAGSSTEGKCDTSSDGILCPFKDYADTPLGYFKPRLLSTAKQLSDSLIVNHGPQSNKDLVSCEAADQRGKARSVNSELCDIGAIELVVNTSTGSNIGSDLFYGETGKMSIADQLQDGELISADQCQALLGNNPNGQPWQAGCMKIVQTNTISKGITTIDQEGNVIYVPNGNWHGSDEFKLLVITSTTRFSDSKNPYIEIPTRIVQSPKNNFENKKVKTSGGSAGVITLISLFGLMGFRRFKK